MTSTGPTKTAFHDKYYATNIDVLPVPDGSPMFTTLVHYYGYVRRMVVLAILIPLQHLVVILGNPYCLVAI